MTAMDHPKPQAKTGRALAAARVRGWLARLARPPRPALQRLRRWEARHLVSGAVVAAAILVLLTVLFDAAAIVGARTLAPGLQRFFDVITDYGKSGWFLWPLGLFLALAAACAGTLSQRLGLIVASLATRALFLFAAIALPGLFVNLVKGVIGRARPFVGGAADPYLFNPFTWGVPAYASFPSGHATTAASVAVAFAALWPRLSPLLWFYALMICVSRIVVTAHHPSDVLGGALVGALGALLVRHYFAARALGFAIDTDGRIHPVPGPSWRRLRSAIKRVAASGPAQ